IRPDSIVYTDAMRSYDTLDISGFRHLRIDHGRGFGTGKAHINGIENFWNQAKRHLRRYNGIPGPSFHLFLAECEWRFNYGPTSRLHKVLSQWANIPPANPS
ncbi:transposase, partial [Pararoseomonas baculiformis]|uniref:transposase n=1 Tax=Pararoseomonas baculiformis TaxID=2820812 RepID=UPI001FD75542